MATGVARPSAQGQLTTSTEMPRALGLRDFRIRCQKDQAKLQIRPEDLELLMSRRKEIVSTLLQYYREVLLDLEVFR